MERRTLIVLLGGKAALMVAIRGKIMKYVKIPDAIVQHRKGCRVVPRGSPSLNEQNTVVM